VSEPVRIPGVRGVAGRIDSPAADSVVVACPPHPQHGGSRSDPRLRTVSDALAPDVACLRFDYGPWDGGEGETVDAGSAVDWAADRYDGGLLQVVVGDRDRTVDWEPVADRARTLGHTVETVSATHQFRRTRDRVGRLVGGFLAARL